MVLKSFIGFVDELPIESASTARLVSGDQQNHIAFRVERKRNTPDSSGRIKPQFLHVRVAGELQRIHIRSAKLWAELFEQPAPAPYFVLHIFRKRIELWIKLPMELNPPPHPLIMHYSNYAV